MSDLFGIAKSGIKAYKESLATTGQNIANVGNENYARREVKLGEIKTGSADVLSISSNSNYGVQVDGITRAFDKFIDVQLQNASSGLSFATSQTLILEKLEKILRPSETTVATKIQKFFSALSTIAQDPSDLAARHIAIDAAQAVVSSIKTVAVGIEDLRLLINENIDGNIKDFNNIIEDLGRVQNKILGNSTPTSTANGLLDQRDQHLRKLSELADISVTYKKNHSVEVSLGTSGQEQKLVSGLQVNKLDMKQADGSVKIYLRKNGANVASDIQIQSGKIAGNLAADINLVETKISLNELTRKLVSEFNESHRFGVDLKGNAGRDFFSMDAVEIKKVSNRESTSQLRVEDGSAGLMGKSFVIEYNAKIDRWLLLNESGKTLKEFQGSTEYKGLRFNIDGKPALGDSFGIKLTDSSAKNLKILVKEAEKIAASSFYLIEPKSTNSSDTEITVSSFKEARDDDLKNLNSIFNQQRDASNSLNFINSGVIGYFKDVDNLTNFSSLKSQGKIQFSNPISSLDTNSKLKINLGGTEHTFSVGNLISGISSYDKIAEALSNGALKSDGGSNSFADLGLSAGGNFNTLTVSSAAQPPYSNFSKLISGSLNSTSGILTQVDEGSADLKLFTREGYQLTGKPLSQEEAASFIKTSNGFSSEAQYSARYLAMGSNGGYLGADIRRLTTAGSHVKSITSVGFADNLNAYGSNSFPTSRPGLNSSISVVTDAGRSLNFSSEPGMMAGQIASKFNKEIAQLGLNAEAFNTLELYGLPNARIQFELYGDNADAAAIDVTISNGETSALVEQINSKSGITGISANVSGNGGIILEKKDGNDISIKNFNIPSGSISARQVDKYGEKIQAAPLTISNGQHVVSGGQVQITSPAPFSLTVNSTTQQSDNSEFEDGFVNKAYDVKQNLTKYTFQSDFLRDGGSLDATRSLAIAPASSYSITIMSENANQSISAKFKPSKNVEFSSYEISKGLLSEIRNNSPKTKFVGDDFTLSDGFPENGSVFEFQIGEQKYSATLNLSLDYEISGSLVKIGTKSYSFMDGLERIVAASKFHVSGPEKDRIAVGFEKNGSSFRLFGTARDGVLSGHALVAASSNSAGQKNSFHVSNTSNAEVLTGEIDLTQADKADFAEIIIGSNSYSLSFTTASDTFTANPALPAGVTLDKIVTGVNKAKLKISFSENISEKNIRLKANDNSASFGFVTASSQATLNDNGFSLSNYNNARLTTTSDIESLADDLISVNGLDGEDLVLISAGNKKPTIIGSVDSKTNELNSREMVAKVNNDDANLMEIFDAKSGDILGSRRISGSNNFLFRDLDWIISGNLAKNDEFVVNTSVERRDDGSNLDRLLALSSFSESTGRGGYSKQYNDLVLDAGFYLRSSEQNLVNSKAAYEIALDRKSEFSGVDLDTEASKLLEQQQAYQALARVLSTAKELVDTLLRAM